VKDDNLNAFIVALANIVSYKPLQIPSLLVANVMGMSCLKLINMPL
jgi:hypothetical protein